MIDVSGLDPIITLQQLADLLKRHPSTIRKDIAKGEYILFPAPCLMRPYKWSREDLRNHYAHMTVDEQRRAYRRLHPGSPRLARRA